MWRGLLDTKIFYMLIIVQMFSTTAHAIFSTAFWKKHNLGSINTWSATSSIGAPTVRYGHTAVWTGSKMIVWGGYNGVVPPSDGGVYDPVDDSWTATSATGAPTARTNHTAVWTGSKMIVWGGANVAVGLNNGGVYEFSGNVMVWSLGPDGKADVAKSAKTDVNKDNVLSWQ